MRVRVVSWAALLCLAACARTHDLPAGGPQFPAALVSPTSAVSEEYRIGPLDSLSLSVFQEPDFTIKEQPVSLAGSFSVPLIGEVRAAGKTTTELAADITARLNKTYLRDAHVSIAVVKAVNYTFTIDGQVNRPGLYDIPGHISLTRAIAIGSGPTEYAKNSDVIIIRQIGEQRYAARFNLSEVNAARQPDPQIIQSDVIVVGYDRGNRLLHDVVSARPGVAALFVALR